LTLNKLQQLPALAFTASKVYTSYRGMSGPVSNQSSQPKISIIIPSYNTARFIEETLQSILNQRYSNAECIVVDGGSNDGTVDILKRYEGQVTWMSEKDEGQSDAINKGLKLAGGDIVSYICADDVYEEDCFRKVAEFFDRNPGTMWVCGKCRIVDENGLETRRPITWYKTFWQRRYSFNRLLIMDFIPQPAVFWRKDLVNEIGFFDINEHLAMDYDYWLRAAVRHAPGFIDDYLARFRVHPRSKSSVSFASQARQALRLGRKYARSEGRNFLVPLQYLSYLLVVTVYSVSDLVARLRARGG
jgi:glycosyltransferase involved in cell wall biosynthesis